VRKAPKDWANLRFEPSIENEFAVELNVTESDELSDTCTSLSERSLDIGLHCTRIAVSQNIFAGSKLKLIVYPDEVEATKYELKGEPK
jgi:hypothetical protein